MRFTWFIVFLLVFAKVNGQRLLLNQIPEELKKDASVVVRSATTEFRVANKGRAIESRRFIITILNDNGKREEVQVVPYSDLEKVLYVSGEIYDRYGKRVKKIKTSDIQDVSASGSNMYTDNRLKVLDFSYPTYPYTIVFEYKVEQNGLMFYPSWFPQDHYATSVQFAELKVIVPTVLGLNYFERGVSMESAEEGGDEIMTWRVEGVKAFEPEPFSPSFRNLVPMVMLTPKEFKMEGYDGSMSSWEAIGAYENKLLEGKQVVPDELKGEVDKVIAGMTDKTEIARAIYQYVQNTTRYVSVQLGIGGWQPYDVQYVYDNGYGDCKALTNYTMALLDYAGIPSIYTNVYAGRGKPDLETGFPNSRFNHVFLAVPMEADTLWLECTSQTNPFGYLGYFTSDRHVLMITDEGGKVVKTPTYDEYDNTQIRRIDVDLKPSGEATARVRTEYRGLQYDNVDGQLYKSKEDQEKWLLKKLKMKSVKLGELNYEHHPDIIPSITETMELTSEGFASVTGNRLFFNVNPMNRSTYIPGKLEERKTDIHLATSFTDIDSVFFKFPEGYHIEHVPDPIEVKNQFGTYSAEYHKSEEGLLYIRKNISRKGNYPAELYNEFREMLRNISRHDKAKIVLAGST